jgi:plasmid stabilization system protein ParE
MKRILHPEVEDEIENAANYYANQSAIAVERFTREVAQAFTAICSNPLAVRYYRDEIQILRLKKFPFAVFFFVHQSQVKVLALAHAARRPDYWLSRYQNWND